MAISISKAQAQALVEGFLDNLGSSKDELQPKESYSSLVLLAGGLVQEAQDNLNAGSHVSSGKLIDSIKALNPELVGRKMVVDVQALYYYDFLNQGVNGTNRSRGSKYSFRYPGASKKMVQEISHWIKHGGLSIQNVGKTGVIFKLEKRRKKISELSSAYAVAISLKQKGLKKTGFFDKAVQVTSDRAADTLGKALKIDIINTLPNKLNDDTI